MLYCVSVCSAELLEGLREQVSGVGQYAAFENFDSKSLWAAQRRNFFKTAVGARLLAMYHPHSHGPPTSLSLFKTKRPRRPLRQMPTKSPQSRPTAHATADAHVRCLPSPQTHSLGKILKNGSGRQEKSGEKSQLELEKKNENKNKICSGPGKKKLHNSQPRSGSDSAEPGQVLTSSCGTPSKPA